MNDIQINPAICLETQQRILKAATEIFAEQGYRTATVRQICAKAKVNLAAINYHFGSKLALYTEVLREAFRQAYQKYPIPNRTNGSAQEYLHDFIYAYLSRLLDQDRLSGVGRLMIREMADPTPALDIVLKEVLRPHFQILQSIITELLDNADEKTVSRCIASIIGQCLFYRFSLPIITRFNPQQTFDKQEIQNIAQHVTQFSLTALQAFTRS